MQSGHRHKLPIVLVLAAFLGALAWSVADAKPYEGFRKDTSGFIKGKAEVLSGDPDSPSVNPPSGGTNQKSLIGWNGSDLGTGSRVRTNWAWLLWMWTRR